MKNLTLIAFLGLSFTLSAQCLEYTYDAAGNRTGRSNVCTLLREEKVADRSFIEIEEEAKNAVIVSPNPAMDRINVSAKGFGVNASTVVLDVSGRQVIQPTSVLEQIDISGLVPGLYVVVVSDERRRVAVTFVKE
ncbi:MAG: T9SS type A sorting domain-containing protein [Saprospiraceae bacterium]|nr:T9SS type A sorting domain-containing protein [Saprospiraceae bacterium]